LTPSRTFVTVPHDRAGRGIRLDAGRGTWRAVGLFLVLTIRLSGVFWVLINATQMSNPFYVWLLMWVPGCAALLTCRILRRPLRSMGWTWNWRYVLIGYLIAIAYCLMASLGIWLSGVGGFPDMDFAHQTAESFAVS
jgi:hypothetical protein